MAAGRKPASKPIAQEKAERVQALILGGGGGVGNMLEEQGHAVFLGQAVAELGVGMEQHAPAQLLELRIAGERLAVMDGDAQAQREEGVRRALPLPAGVEVGLAGIAFEVDGGAKRGPDAATPQLD